MRRAADDVEARKGDEDDGVGWFVAVPALMKPAPININVPIPGIPCDKKFEVNCQPCGYIHVLNDIAVMDMDHSESVRR